MASIVGCRWPVDSSLWQGPVAGGWGLVAGGRYSEAGRWLGDQWPVATKSVIVSYYTCIAIKPAVQVELQTHAELPTAPSGSLHNFSSNV